MTRSFDQAKRASGELAGSMDKVNAMTLEQKQAAGFAPQPPDPDAGLPRYEDVAGQPENEQAMVDRAVEMYLQRQQQAVEPPFVQQNPYAPPPVPQNLQMQPQPTDPTAMVGLLMQQVQQLMQDNAQLRAQLMQALQGQQQQHVAQPNGAGPSPRHVLRASAMSPAQREAAEYSGAGLLGE